MSFTYDFLDGDVLVWSIDGEGVRYRLDTAYRPTIYVGAASQDALRTIRTHLDRFPDVASTAFESWRPGFRHETEPHLRINVTDIDAVTDIARDIHAWDDPGAYQLFNVDFSREFRYCLENDVTPVPGRDLRVLDLDVSIPELAREDGVRRVTVDGEPVCGDPATVATAIETRIQSADPDVLCVSSSDLLARLHEVAAREEWDYQLGRVPGWQQLAGQSTYESYGRVGHSPARYNVPGRVIIDRANTFFLEQSTLSGCLDLVERSGKPLQELAWASIGNVLTAIQIHEARQRNILVPWKAWRPERFKTMRQLHDADRGGLTFAPETGLHERVHELDFSSLYPNIIITRNVSPETVRCDCHPERSDVPELGYSICEKDGYLPEVLQPLVEDRERIKRELQETSDPDRIEELQGRSDALKWILVSCFGYQGFSNAKFGRIECHEAINAFAREILLDAKATLEANGWEVVHGIVDSIWVRGAVDDPTPLEEVAIGITEDVGIRLEYEASYDWVAFVPMRTSKAGALTKYFGRLAGTGANEDENGDGDGDATPAAYKYRGIECRQHSTPAFVANAQRTLIGVLDRTRSPEAVCDRLDRYVSELRSGTVDTDRLLVRNRVSKTVDEYTQFTRNAAALRRGIENGVEYHPGQSVEYVVVDDSKTDADRVRLAHERGERYDQEFYETALFRAAASVLSPLGWRESDIREYIAETRDATLQAFGESDP